MNNTNREVLCRVCRAIVPRRREYQPTCCEACQKFFRRCCASNLQLKCAKDDGNCMADGGATPGRRSCAKCRFERCLAAGMHSKYYNVVDGSRTTKRKQTEESSPEVSVKLATSESVSGCATPASYLESSEQSSVELQPLPLVKEPILFDGSMLENILRTSVEAFISLYNMEFLALKRLPQHIADPAQLFQVGMQQTEAVLAMASDYARIHQDAFPALRQLDLRPQIGAAVSNFAGVINNLPNSSGGSCFGLHESLIPMFLSAVPEFKPALETARELQTVLGQWDPTFVETALMLGALFFQDSDNTKPVMFQFQRNLRHAYQLQCSAMLRNRSDELEKRLIYFQHCLDLARCATDQLMTVTALQARNSAYFARVCETVYYYDTNANTDNHIMDN